MREHTIAIFMWMTAVFVASNIYLLIPIYSEVADGLSITYDDAVFSSTLFIFCYALGLLSFGPISERFNKKYVLVFGMLISCLITLCLSFSSSLISFYTLRGLQGFVLGSFAPVAYAYCFDTFQPKMRTFIIAVINTGFLMAGIIGQILSSSLVSIYNWKTVFHFFGAMYFLLSLFSLFILPNVPKNRMDHSVHVKNHTKNLLQPKIIIGLFLTFFTLMSFVAFYEELAQQFANQEEMLFYSRCIGLIGTPLSLFTGKWLKKYSPSNIMILCLLLIICSFAFMLLSKQLFFITCVSIILVSAISVLIPSLITFIGEAASEKRATAISLYSFTLLTGASVGPIIASLLPFQGILYLFITIFLVSFSLLIWDKKKKLV